MDLAQALTDASNTADFYQTVAIDHTGRTSVVAEDIASDVYADSPDDDAHLTYGVNTPYNADHTTHRLVTYPEASGALSPHVVAELTAEPLAPGEAYALQTEAVDYWPDDDPSEPVTLGYLVIVSRTAAGNLTWEN